MALSRVALAGLLLGITAVSACTTLRRVQPVEFLAKNSPDVLWVTHINKTVVPVVQPEIAGDTLRGMWQGTQRRVAIPLNEIRRAQAKLPDHMKTALFITGLGVGAVSAVYFIWVVQAGPERVGVYCGVDIRNDPILFC
jgi:hypothetical protein